MNGKNLIAAILLIAIIGIGVYNSKYGTNKTDSAFTEKFLSKLEKCSAYTETMEPLAGVKITNKINGKKDGKCEFIYQDKTICHLTNAQIKTITDGAKGIGETNYESTAGGAAVKYTSDPLSIALAKLINDPAICTLQE